MKNETGRKMGKEEEETGEGKENSVADPDPHLKKPPGSGSRS